MGYYDDLKDNRWKTGKRLEILERDNFQCTLCGCTDKQLQVHHGYYDPWKRLWEYEDDTLYTLCEDCHKNSQRLLAEVHRHIGKVHPKDHDKLLAKLPDLAFEVTNDITPGEAYELTHEYHPYDATINLNPEENELYVREAVRKAKQAFPGISFDFTSTDDAHGAVIVDGPDKAVSKMIEEWVTSHVY